MNLKSNFSGWLLAAISIMALPTQAIVDYDIVLIGGGLEICSSAEQHHCSTKLKITDSTHTKNHYNLSSKRFEKLKTLYTKNEALHTPEMTKLVAKLSVTKFPSKVVDDRDLKAFFRAQNIDLRRNISEDQKQFIWDVLQQPNVLKRFLQKDGVKKVKVNIHASKHEFVARSLREFLTQVKGDEIVFVTAANSDAFEDVHLLKQVFDQLDVDATWLPMDTALANLWRNTNIRNSETLEVACTGLEQQRRETVGRYNRGKIYPELNEQLIKVCQEPKSLRELIDDADGVYFHDGSPDVLIASMMNDKKTPLPFFKRIIERHNEGNLVLGFNGASINALSGIGRSNGVIIDGSSHDALQSGFEVKELTKNARLISNVKQNQMMTSGLGLFDNIIFDHQVSSASKQIRLMMALLQSDAPIGVGLDDRTVLLIDKTKNGAKFLVTGEAGATILSNLNGELIRQKPALARNIKMAYVTQEDKVDLANNKLVFDFANWKYSSNSNRQPVVNAGDALRSNNFHKTMYMLCSTAANKATLKNIELGKGHQIEVTKLKSSVSVAGSRNVNGQGYGYCSYRDYEIKAIPLQRR